MFLCSKTISIFFSEGRVNVKLKVLIYNWCRVTSSFRWKIPETDRFVIAIGRLQPRLIAYGSSRDRKTRGIYPREAGIVQVARAYIRYIRGVTISGRNINSFMVYCFRESAVKFLRSLWRGLDPEGYDAVRLLSLVYRHFSISLCRRRGGVYSRCSTRSWLFLLLLFCLFAPPAFASHCAQLGSSTCSVCCRVWKNRRKRRIAKKSVYFEEKKTIIFKLFNSTYRKSIVNLSCYSKCNYDNKSCRTSH